MIITLDSPNAHQVVVYKNGVPVGLVQEIDTERQTMKRYDIDAWKRGDRDIIEEPYDTLEMRGVAHVR